LFIVSFADTTSAAFNKAEEFYLSNGMHVVVIPNHKAPVVHHTVLYKVGSIDEPQGKGGIAHLLEHLMFRGTHKFKDGKFDNLINFNGGKSNAATSQNYTYYYQLLGVQSLELAMYLEADRMYGLKLDNDIFIKEREVVYQERQQRMNADTTSSFWEQYNKIFWGDCPYGESISGTEREIKNISIDDIKEFYKNFYAPNNALLILSGDIDIQTAKNLAEKYYGSIKAKPIKSKENLEIWDEQLIKLGLKIHEYRKEFLEKINEKIKNIHLGISEEKENIEIKYKSNINIENYREKLIKNREIDIEKGYTSVGVHRDDFEIYINGKNAAIYGSQGQQRSSIISLKLAEAEVIYDEIEDYPIILLDDFMSELDQKRVKGFIKNIKNNQVIITTTDKISLDTMVYNLFKVNNAKIEKVEQ